MTSELEQDADSTGKLAPLKSLAGNTSDSGDAFFRITQLVR